MYGKYVYSLLIFSLLYHCNYIYILFYKILLRSAKVCPPYPHVFAISGLFIENKDMFFINFTLVTEQLNFSYSLRTSPDTC